MSLCLDTNAVLSNPPSSASDSEPASAGTAAATSCEPVSVSSANKEPISAPPQHSLPLSVQCSQPLLQDASLPSPHVPIQAKLVFTNNSHMASAGGASQVIQKVPTTSVITVVNATGPLTILKCSNSNDSTSPQQFTLVNSAPLGVCNTIGKPITVVNAPPITVVRAVSNINSVAAAQTAKENNNAIGADVLAGCTTAVGAVAASQQQPNGGLSTTNIAVAVERPATVHNVFVKNTSADGTELVQQTGLISNDVVSQKIVPGGGFTQNNVIQSIPVGNGPKLTNNQKPPTAGVANKIKVLNNVVVSSAINQMTNCSNTNQTSLNIVLNKSLVPKHYPQQKLVPSPLQGVTNAAAASTKLGIGSKNSSVPPNNLTKVGPMPSSINKPAAVAVTATAAHNKVHQKLFYPTQKTQIRTLPANNAYPVPKPGVKSLSPQYRGIPGSPVLPKGGGGMNNKLRTLPSQRSPKPSNKPNYIGKHAIQGQKYKSSFHGPKVKGGGGSSGCGIKVTPATPNVSNVFAHRMPPSTNTGISYHQVLTANIIQSLSENNNGSSNRSYDYSSSYEVSRSSGSDLHSRNSGYSDSTYPPSGVIKPQSNLEALSFVCQAVLLDHNYNAAPPPESPPRNSPPSLNQYNGGAYYSPSNSSRTNRLSLSSSNTLTTLSSTSTSSILPSNNNILSVQDDDAASDISCGDDRKPTSEGEDTDTAPEAEAASIKTEAYSEHYGDYVTRCLCGLQHDDGYMIECDKCKVWQHVRCVIKSNRKVPEDYLCEVCDTSKVVDRAKARSLQQQWLKENEEREAKLRKDMNRIQEAKLKETKLKEAAKLKERMSDSDSSDAEQGPPTSLKHRVASNGRRKTEQVSKHTFRQRKDLARQEIQRRTVKKKEKKIKKKPTKSISKAQSDEDNHEIWPHSSISHIPQLRQWIDNYEDAVTNHYSPELRARISSIRINGTHSDLSNKIDSSVHNCQVFTQNLTGLKYLISTENLSPSTPVIELRGKYMLSNQHRNGPGHGGGGGSLSTRQHSQRPGPFLFFYRLPKDNTEVCVDTRTYGNDARFVRRSCTPNAELQHCIEKGVLHLYIVTIVAVDKNCELTIKHESHDLAVVGTTNIACACGKPDDCAVNKTPVKKNGETSNDRCSVSLRKRRGRRTISNASDHEALSILQTEVKEEVLESAVPVVVPQIKQEPVEIKVEEEPKALTVDCEFKPVHIKEERPSTPISNDVIKEENNEKVEIPCPMSPEQMSPVKKTSVCEGDDKKDSPVKDAKEAADKKKLSREERKIEAYMKAFERMERQQQKKQENQAKQAAHRRESEPSPNQKEEDSKAEAISRSKRKSFRRKGRSRTVSTHSQSRRNRLNSADSSYATSGDECLLSPGGESHHSVSRTYNKEPICEARYTRESALHLNIPSGHCSAKIENNESPVRDVDCNSNSADASPDTPLSTSCLLVAAAVEPLEPSFKFPKTKKGLMNEWLNKSPECVQLASAISPSSLTPHFVSPNENSMFYESGSNGNNNYFQNSTAKSFMSSSVCGPNQATVTYNDVVQSQQQQQPHGNAKKRWLRQAISEDHSESPNNSRPESPSLSVMVAPPKKRRLPRESLSSSTSPPTTPTNVNCPVSLPVSEGSSKLFHEQEDRVEIVTPAGCDGDSPTPVLIDDATLSERVAEMQQEIGACFRLPAEPRDLLKKEDPLSPNNNSAATIDPRITRPLYNSSNSEHLVAAVEKNLSILGCFEDQRTENNVTPAKRKLSISEYRKRKQLIVNEKPTDDSTSEDATSASSRASPQKIRVRSNSASSTTSVASTDEEESSRPNLSEEKTKILSAFNSEPTGIEMHRESVSLRLKKTFGLSLDDETLKPAPSTSFLRLSELCSEKFASPPSSSSTTTHFVVGDSVVLASPSSTVPLGTTPMTNPPLTFKCDENNHAVVPGSGEENMDELAARLGDGGGVCNNNPVVKERRFDIKPEMFYTPDDEDMEKESHLELSKKSDELRQHQQVECLNYVPPFNNPVYPNSSFTAFGSVIDDAPYEGRNPSPPPELSSNAPPGSYLSP